MSENIQSISQGTFTIGQTSATNFVAGPGIKIDSPSAGTVRVGNDETVLWEGTPTNSNIQCSEALSNFEQVILYGKWNYNSTQAIYAATTIPGTAGSVQVGGLGLNTTATPTDFFCTYIDYSISGKNLTSRAKLRKQLNGQNSSKSDTILIYKIIGINRISGNA